jgi:hypothetical protein
MLDDQAIMVHNLEMSTKATLFMTLCLLLFPNSTSLGAHRSTENASIQGTFDV